MIELVENRSIPSTPVSSRSIAWQRALLRKRIGFLQAEPPGKIRLDLPAGHQRALAEVMDGTPVVAGGPPVQSRRGFAVDPQLAGCRRGLTQDRRHAAADVRQARMSGDSSAGPRSGASPRVIVIREITLE